MLEHPQAEHHRAHPHAHQGEYLGDLPHFLLEGGLPLVLVQQEPGDAAHLGGHPRGGEDHPAPARRDHGAADDHVAPLRQRRFRGKGPAGLLVDREGFPRHGGFIRLELGRPEDPAVGGDAVSRFQEDQVPGDQGAALQKQLLPASDHPALGGGELLEGFQGLAGVVLLGDGDDRVEDHDQQDDGGVQPILPAPGKVGQGRGGQEDQDHGVLQLAEDPQQQAGLLALGQTVLSVVLQTPGGFRGREAMLGVCVQFFQHLAYRGAVKGSFHVRSLVSQWLSSLW